jgi:antitoxin component YwqK of YwqJK toxin-antitoxin module
MTSSNTELLNGQHKELFTNGGLSGEGQIKNGKHHGKWKFYYQNGVVNASGKYIDGELDGYREWWRENGQPLQAGAFNNGNKLIIGSDTTIMVNSGMKEHMWMARRLVSGRFMISLAR